MPNDLTVGATSDAISAPTAPQPISSAAGHSAAASSGGGKGQTNHAGSATSSANTSANLEPSPFAQLDPALGMVVLEFFNSQGQMTSSIPTQKQLEAFQQNEDARAHVVDVMSTPD